MCTGTHAFIPVPNTARVRMVYTEFGQELMNVFYFESAGPFSSADLIALNASIVTEWTANIRTLQLSNVELLLVESTALDTAMGFQETLAVGVVGALSGTPAPSSITLAVKFASGLAGRSQRGRMYWIGTADLAVIGNQYDPSSAAAILAGVVAFFTNVQATTGFIHVVVSLCAAGAWRTTGQTTPITSILLTDNNVDSQRRRLTGRGI